MAVSGSCQCGSIKYTLPNKPIEICDCYCSICKSLHNKTYTSFTKYSLDDINFTFASQTNIYKIILIGIDKIKSIKSSPRAKRYFCANCNDLIFMYYLDSPSAWIATDTIINELNDVEHYPFCKS